MIKESLTILWPAFLCGLLVLSIHVPLGRLVLDRGIVFIDLAIAQLAGLGVVIADYIGFAPDGWSVQASAGAAALLGAGLLLWTERRFGAVQEAIIGVIFVLAASLEVVLLSANPHGAEHLKDLLVGEILWVTPGEILRVAALYLPLLIICCRSDLTRQRWLFYIVFALAITASVQLVGVFLVFTSLIVPALGARASNASRPLATAYGIGVTGYLLGLVASTVFDFPTGAAVVCALVLVAIAVVAGAEAMLVVRRAL